MHIGASIQAWRVSRNESLDALAGQINLSLASLEAIENGTADPPVSTIEALATALRIPPSWLYCHPRHLEQLTTDSDGEVLTTPSADALDPVLERVLEGAHLERELYVLLTTVLQAGDPKLRLAAEASLRSLAKQARKATVPWQSRPPGHFEPPAD